MNDVSRLIAGLSPEQRALLALRLKKQGAAFNSFPLSFAQQRLWFLDQLNPGTSAYNISSAFHLSGDLNLIALVQSINEIVRRHESLRTTFIMIEGQPMQVIAPALSLPAQIIDLTNIAEAAREPEALRLAREESIRPFDLARGPLFRFALIRLGEQDHVALLTFHHIVSDGWSMGVFIRETGILYESFSQGAQSPLPALSIQYADFARWQRQWLQGDVLESHLSYWRKQLGDSVPILEWPADRPRPPVWSSRGATQRFFLPEALSKSLEALSHQQGATLFMTLLASFKTLLYRYTDQKDIVVGTPIANRTRAEAEALIGFFANTLVLRTDLSGDPCFTTLLDRVRKVALESYHHQELPFEKLVEDLQPERDLSRNPLFQVMFILQNTQAEELNLSGLKLTPVETGGITANFDLNINFVHSGQELFGWLTYSTDLFDVATIDRLLNHFRALLESIVANPKQNIADLPMLTQQELEQLLFDWNDTKLDIADALPVHKLFEAQVEQTPDAIACAFDQELLTYSELNRRANQLAHYLRCKGVSPNELVGICVERSVEMVVGILGILKSGGAYVPLDPAYPQERLAFMINDAKLKLVLTEQRLLNQLACPETDKFCLDTNWPEISKQKQTDSVSGATLENLAYVIYTSGSTGNPKGVQVPHFALNNFLNSMRRAPGLTQQDALLAITTLSFDIAGLELYLPLIVGARLVVLSREAAYDGSKLASALTDSGATVMQATPSAWRLLLESGWKGDPDLKILCGGEALPAELAHQLLGMGSSLWNLYGPTETTIWSAACEIEPTSGPVTIGRPIANTEIYILDRRFHPAPVGVPGELYIAGHGLARGYLDRAELTAEKFIPNPFASQAGERMYRTGDLARYKPDSSIDYLGRVDHQVKLRGFRIELGEIEAALSRHEMVREAVVIAREDAASEKRLVAYVVAKPESSLTANHLRSLLKERLPDFMIPSNFIFLEALPLTPNGKLDRRRLPAPGQSRPKLEGDFIAPGDVIELQVAQIWEDVLNVRPIGVRDNFFEIGGHSLTAAHLMFKIQERFGKQIPLATLFKEPTVEHLANILRQHTDCQPFSPLVTIQPFGSKPAFFATHPMGGQVLCYYQLARLLGESRPFHALQAPELADIGKQGDHSPSIEEMAAQYIEAIRSVQPAGPYHLGGLSFGGVVAFEMAQQLQRQGEKIALLALLDTAAPFKKEEDTDAALLAGLARDLASRAGRDLLILSDELEPLEPDQQLNYVLERIKEADVVPVDVGPDVALPWIRNVLKGWHSRGRALRDYRPQKYQGRITLLRCSEINPGHLKDAAMRDLTGKYLDDPTLGWGDLSAEAVEIHYSAGRHETMLLEPNVQVLAELLKGCLQKTELERSI